MKNVVNNISNGRDLEINIPRYFQEMMDKYSKNSYVRFTMNYYTYFESLKDGESVKNGRLNTLVQRFSHIVNKYLLEEGNVSQLFEAVKDVDNIRNDVIAHMKGVTSVVDILNMYEYCLNRVEYRFKEEDKYSKLKDEDVTRDVMKYIVAEEDNMVISMKICDILRQLPVRMTKARFFEYVKEGLKVYKGSEKKSLDDFMYMVRTSSTMDVSDDAFEVSSDITEILTKLKSVDYKNITGETYEEVIKMLNFAADYIERLSSDYMLFEELVNDLYVILLAMPYADNTSEDRKVCINVVKGVNNLLSETESLDMDEEIEGYLMELEGRQEEYTSFIQKYEYVFDLIENSYVNIVESLMLSHQYESLKLMQKLQSASIFIEFNEENVEKEAEYSDEEYIEKAYEEFTKDYKLFSEINQKLFTRAAMANILSGLPVFFTNLTELQDYIYNSLSQCSDQAEKTACKEILYSIIEY